MNTKLKALAGAGALALAAMTGAAITNTVEAQSAAKAPIILVVDQARIVGQSASGKTIGPQAEKVRDAVAAELEAEANKLKTDIEKYQKNASLMSDEVRQKTEQELAVRQQVDLPQQAQLMEQAFRLAVEKAQSKILVESQPIMKEIIDRRGATVMLDRSAVMYAAPETDVTQEVLAELDKKLKTVEVEKISLAELKKRVAEAQAAQLKAAEDAKKKK